MRRIGVTLATFIWLFSACTTATEPATTDQPSTTIEVVQSSLPPTTSSTASLSVNPPVASVDCGGLPLHHERESYVADDEGCWVDPFVVWHIANQGWCEQFGQAQSIVMGLPLGATFQESASSSTGNFAFDPDGSVLPEGPFGRTITHDQVPFDASGVGWFVGDREIWTTSISPDRLFLVGRSDAQVWEKWDTDFNCE